MMTIQFNFRCKSRNTATWILVASLCACVVPLKSSIAQTYPSKPIKLVIPAPPGGGTDHVARLVGAKFQDTTGQPWVIDNRGGANGIIGTDVVAKSPADGYSIVMAYVSHSVNPSMYKKIPYDTLNDFEPVTQVTTQPLILVTHPSLPVKTVKQLIALAKGRTGELNYGSSGSGTGPHLAMELLAVRGGVKINHIPYKGGGPLTSAVVAGEVPIAFFTPPPSIPQVNAGRMRAIAVSGKKRSPLLPDVPTVAESGYPDYEASTWYGLLAPAGTPKDIVSKLQKEVSSIVRTRDISDKLAQQGVEPVGSTPEEFARHIRNEMAKWDKVVKSSGARVD